mmetsp:Transcript_28561/g.32369  ORF Transcript_28561/g.32369 Transcript_28561/m.32369 type:complete len:289 (+) Transcript_28561:180-1046(+)
MMHVLFVSHTVTVPTTMYAFLLFLLLLRSRSGLTSAMATVHALLLLGSTTSSTVVFTVVSIIFFLARGVATTESTATVKEIIIIAAVVVVVSPFGSFASLSSIVVVGATTESTAVQEIIIIAAAVVVSTFGSLSSIVVGTHSVSTALGSLAARVTVTTTSSNKCRVPLIKSHDVVSLTLSPFAAIVVSIIVSFKGAIVAMLVATSKSLLAVFYIIFTSITMNEVILGVLRYITSGLVVVVVVSYWGYFEWRRRRRNRQRQRHFWNLCSDVLLYNISGSQYNNSHSFPN